MENLYLIVGLGNPGQKYAGTRHNAGFRLVEKLADRWRAGWADEKKFEARLAKVEREGRKLLLCEPQTFMNLSGQAMGAVAGFYRIAVERILVVVDDADLPLGEIRLRSQGSSGGHHGLESAEQHLATQNYARLRLGIGRQRSEVREITGHVLSEFNAAERKLFEKVLDRAADQAECWLTDGVAKAMSQFNGTVQVPV